MNDSNLDLFEVVGMTEKSINNIMDSSDSDLDLEQIINAQHDHANAIAHHDKINDIQNMIDV